jgi:hypothetical protein
MPAAIRIPVVAAMDSSWDRVFSKVEASSRRARKVVVTEADLAAKEEAKAWAAAERELARMEKEKTNEVKKATRERVQAERDAQREVASEAKRTAREREDAEKAMLKSVVAANRDAEREIAKTERDKKRTGDARGRAIGSGVSAVASVGARAIGFAASIAGDVARGAGVDLDAGSHFRNASNLETTAANLSNQGYMENDPRNGVRVDSKKLEDELLNVGDKTGYSGNDIGEALSGFVSKTGDLQMGRDLIQQIGVVSRASGADVKDMADATGDLANAFEDGPDKAKQVGEALRILAGQGKVGAVEIRDLAAQMAKVTAAAGQFEGGAQNNIATFGALAQEARRKGGASSATMATSSLGAFADTFSKSARLKEFRALGINVDGAGGKVRDPMEILIDSLSKTHGNNEAMGKLFASSQARRVTRGFEDTYKTTFAATQGTDAEKDAAAIAAVREEFNKLKNAAMSQEEVMTSFSNAMSTSQVEAQTFNTEMDRLAAETKGDLVPALRELTPVIKNELVPAFKDAISFVTWFAHSNTDNSRDTDKATARAKSAIAGGTPEERAAAEAALQAAVDRQGEDRLKSDSFIGKAGAFVKGFGDANFSKPEGWDDMTAAEKERHRLKVAFGVAGIQGGMGAVDAQKKEDDETRRTFQEANKTLKDIHATLLAQKPAPPPAGGPSQVVPGTTPTTR